MKFIEFKHLSVLFYRNRVILFSISLKGGDKWQNIYKFTVFSGMRDEFVGLRTRTSRFPK